MMNNIIGFILLNLAAVTAHAACEAIPFELADGSKNFEGLIAKGNDCRGITSHATYTADQYIFQGKAGDTLAANVYLPEKCSSPSSLCGSFAYLVVLDPQGLQIGNATYDNHGIRDHFSTTLMTSGLYKLIVTGSNINAIDGTDYGFSISVSTPKDQPSPVSCPADTYDKGKLTINSVEVPNGLGGVIKYQANLSLQPFSNPLSFALDSAQPLE